jgi:hypothetical protein
MTAALSMSVSGRTRCIRRQISLWDPTTPDLHKQYGHLRHRWQPDRDQLPTLQIKEYLECILLNEKIAPSCTKISQ